MNRQVFLDGSRLKAARKTQGLTQPQLAAQAGVNERTIRAAERGEASPWLMFDLASQLGMSPWDVICHVRKPRSDRGMRRKGTTMNLVNELEAIGKAVPPEQWEKAADEIAVRRRLDEPGVPWAEVKKALGL